LARQNQPAAADGSVTILVGALTGPTYSGLSLCKVAVNRYDDGFFRMADVVAAVSHRTAFKDSDMEDFRVKQHGGFNNALSLDDDADFTQHIKTAAENGKELYIVAVIKPKAPLGNAPGKAKVKKRPPPTLETRPLVKMTREKKFGLESGPEVLKIQTELMDDLGFELSLTDKEANQWAFKYVRGLGGLDKERPLVILPQFIEDARNEVAMDLSNDTPPKHSFYAAREKEGLDPQMNPELFQLNKKIDNTKNRGTPHSLKFKTPDEDVNALMDSSLCAGSSRYHLAAPAQRPHQGEQGRAAFNATHVLIEDFNTQKGHSFYCGNKVKHVDKAKESGVDIWWRLVSGRPVPGLEDKLHWIPDSQLEATVDYKSDDDHSFPTPPVKLSGKRRGYN
jgi:hypothetical protein